MVKPPGAGGTFVYKVYRYVLPQRVCFLSRFGLKTGTDFEHFRLKLGMVIVYVLRSCLPASCSCVV